MLDAFGIPSDLNAPQPVLREGAIAQSASICSLADLSGWATAFGIPLHSNAFRPLRRSGTFEDSRGKIIVDADGIAH
jgi:hypothetical protein